MVAFSGQSTKAMLAMALTRLRAVTPLEVRYALGNRWCRSMDRGAADTGSSSSRIFIRLNSTSASNRFNAAQYAKRTGDFAPDVSSRFGSEISQ